MVINPVFSRCLKNPLALAGETTNAVVARKMFSTLYDSDSSSDAPIVKPVRKRKTRRRSRSKSIGSRYSTRKVVSSRAQSKGRGGIKKKTGLVPRVGVKSKGTVKRKVRQKDNTVGENSSVSASVTVIVNYAFEAKSRSEHASTEG